MQRAGVKDTQGSSSKRESALVSESSREYDAFDDGSALQVRLGPAKGDFHVIFFRCSMGGKKKKKKQRRRQAERVVRVPSLKQLRGVLGFYRASKGSVVTLKEW